MMAISNKKCFPSTTAMRISLIMRNILIYFTFFFFLLGCNERNKETEYGRIDLESGFSQKSFYLLSEVAEEVEYVFLETNDSGLLAEIHRIEYNPPNFFIMDRFKKSILIFNETGKYVNKISALGQGPHEYTEIYNFDVFDNTVYILDYDLKKIFIYDVSGKFINSFTVDERPSFLKINSDSDILLASANRQVRLNDGFVFSQYDKNFSLKRKFHQMEHNGREVESVVHSFYWQKDTLVYWEWNIFDTVYNILPEGKIEMRFKIDPGKIPSSLIQSREKANLIEYNQFDISRLVETDDYVFLFCVYHRTSYPLIYSKKENRIIGIERFLMNDIDGGIPFWPILKLSDNKVCTTMSPDEIKNYLSRQIVDYYKGFNYESYRPKLDYNVEKHKKLLEQLEKTDDMSNPVLMIVTMKSSSKRLN